jgi:tetratricopeptide (TPR) repeat protein
MLLDRGLVERHGDAYRRAGSIETLDVPETLHALIAARLDGLTPDERRTVQDAAVLGKSFTREGLAALSGRPVEELDPVLRALIRKEILTVQSDPRSPERGQYAFLQDLLKRVAYETLSRKDRKQRHLAAAAHLEQAWGSAEQEVVEVVAAHLLDAIAADPEGADTDEIREKAFERLVRAAGRAASLAASEDAQRYYEHAAGLTARSAEQAKLLEQAGEMALRAGHVADAIDRCEQAIALFEAEGETHAAARVVARLGRALWLAGDLAGAAERLEASFRVLADDEPDADLAMVAAEIGRLRYFLGDLDAASARVERALEIAEALALPEVLAQALNTKHLVLDTAGRYEEAFALLQRAEAIAREHGLSSALQRALINLAYQLTARDDFAAARLVDLEGLELTRLRGDREQESLFLMHLLGDEVMLGDWDEALRRAGELGESVIPHGRLIGLPHLLVSRGEAEAARREFEADTTAPTSGEVQTRVLYALAESIVLRAEGRTREALAAAERALAERERVSLRHGFVKHALVEAVEAAFDLDDLERVGELLGEWERMRPVERTPWLEAHEARFRARLATRRGEDEDVEGLLSRAQSLFRDLQMPFYLAVALLEHAEWLADLDRPDDAEALLGEAVPIFERLGARPWVTRAAEARAPGRALRQS